MDKIIWMCWFQGEDDPRMPPLNRECIKRWRELNEDYDVRLLCDKTISHYVPEFVDIIKSSPNRSRAAQSDLLRILLLSKYGGTWVDASVYPTQSLSDFYSKVVNDVGFFSYRFIPRGSYNARQGICETVSWFLCVNKPKHDLIENWKIHFTNAFNLNKEWPYFTFHQTLTNLYDTDPVVEYVIDNMVQIDEKIPHSAIHNWEDRVDSYMYKRPNIKC